MSPRQKHGVDELTHPKPSVGDFANTKQNLKQQIKQTNTLSMCERVFVRPCIYGISRYRNNDVVHKFTWNIHLC